MILILIRGLPSVSHRRPRQCSWRVLRIVNSAINHVTTKLTCSNEISIFIIGDPPHPSPSCEHLLPPGRILFPICNASLIKQRHLLTGSSQWRAIGSGCLMRRVFSAKSELGYCKVNIEQNCASHCSLVCGTHTLKYFNYW